MRLSNQQFSEWGAYDRGKQVHDGGYKDMQYIEYSSFLNSRPIYPTYHDSGGSSIMEWRS